MHWVLRVCVCFLCFIFSFVHQCKTPKCSLAHYHQRITTAIIIDSFKFIRYVTVMMHTFVQRMCTHHSFVLKSFLFSFMYTFFSSTHSQNFHSLTSISSAIQINSWCMTQPIYKFRCFTFRFCHCIGPFSCCFTWFAKSSAWCSWVAGVCVFCSSAMALWCL